jgi:poly(A) polymerase/tRNA nucleotidyltransferase (CCA-adding enzyme)
MLLPDIAKPRTYRKADDRITFYNHNQIGSQMAKDILVKWGAPDDLIEYVPHMIRWHMEFLQNDASHKTIKRFINKIGKNNIDDWFSVRKADSMAGCCANSKFKQLNALYDKVNEVLNYKEPFGIKHLQISGYDVMDILGLQSGPDIGKKLEHLLDLVKNGIVNNTKEELEKELKSGRD